MRIHPDGLNQRVCLRSGRRQGHGEVETVMGAGLVGEPTRNAMHVRPRIDLRNPGGGHGTEVREPDSRTESIWFVARMSNWMMPAAVSSEPTTTAPVCGMCRPRDRNPASQTIPTVGSIVRRA